MLLSLILATSPLPRVANYCPSGYMIQGGYCVPYSAQSRHALEREGKSCPSGYFVNGAYCVEY